MQKWILFSLVAVLLTGCHSPDATASVETVAAAETAVTITDDLGRELTVSQPTRVAALLGSYADLWYLAGGEVVAASVDAFEDFSLPLSEQVVCLGETKRLNLEFLLSAQPDLVLASTNSPQHLEWQQSLEGAGIPVLYFGVSSREEYLRMLEACTKLTGHPERYAQYGTEMMEEIEAMLDRRKNEPPQTALLLNASATGIRVKQNRNHVLGEMLEDFGCRNIADSDVTLLEQLNVESILLQNPDCIFWVQSGEDFEGTRKRVEAMFAENPLWQQLDAVKNGRVYPMDKHLYRLKPNARWAEAYAKLESLLYAET